MEKDWSLVYSGNKLYQIEIIKEKLSEAGIPADEINKKDSAFLVGDIELYVPTRYLEQAKTIIREAGF